MSSDRATRWTAVGTVYLLHFGEPYFHARHYVGFARDVSRRLRQHRSGRGARLMVAIAEADIGFELARTWTNVTRAFERRLHRNGNNPKFCPICAGKCMRPMRPRVEPTTGVAC